MDYNSENNNKNVHFPVDRDAPVIPGRGRNSSKNLFDIFICLFISVSTVITVSLSIYIIISKFS